MVGHTKTEVPEGAGLDNNIMTYHAPMSRAETNQMIELFRSGLTMGRISKTMNRAICTISNHLRKHPEYSAVIHLREDGYRYMHMINSMGICYGHRDSAYYQDEEQIEQHTNVRFIGANV